LSEESAELWIILEKIALLWRYFHQPVDNFDSVFKEAYEKSYKPFIDVLEKYPAIKVTLHYS
jgi:alpha-amylase